MFSLALGRTEKKVGKAIPSKEFEAFVSLLSLFKYLQSDLLWVK